MSDSNSSPVAVGKRFELLRKITRQSAKDFAVLAEVSAPSITYWEHGQIDKPIGPKAMKKVLTAFKKLELDVTERWLRFGEGDPPTYKNKPIAFKRNELGYVQDAEIANTSLLSNKDDPNKQLAALLGEEIKSFISVDGAVITKVDHSYLSPYFDKGDLVGGIWQISSLFKDECICIIELHKQLHVCRVKKGQKEGNFELSYSRDNSDAATSLQIRNLALERIAPVIRIWR